MAVIIDGSTGLTFPNNTTQGSAGKVLQVVFGSSNTYASTTSTTYADTPLTATITPTSSTSKILVMTSFLFALNATGTGCGFRLARGSTTIFDPSPINATGPYFNYIATTTGLYTTGTINFLDSPGTTSATAYKLQYRSYTSGASTFFNGDTGAIVQTGTSTIILMEVAA